MQANLRSARMARCLQIAFMKLRTLSVLLLLSGCATRSSVPVFEELPLTESSPESHVITPGDKLFLPSDTHPESRLEVIVDGEGDIELPRIGKVCVLGMTCDQAGSKIWHAYRDQGLVPGWLPPRRIPTFQTRGEVTCPGTHEYLPGITLSKAIELSGGLTRATRGSRLVIRRRDGSIQQ
jgi:protein involved in polysaccharide export with SLBB domain